MINEIKKPDTWKIQLTIATNFISSKDIYEESEKSDNIEIMINNKADEVLEEFFQSPLSRYQSELESLMKNS